MAGARTKHGRAAPGDPWKTAEDDRPLLRAILWLAGRARLPLGAMGVDYLRFRELLRTRLVLMERTRGESSKAWGSAGAALGIFMTGFFGFLTGLIALVGRDAGLWVAGSQALAMVMLAILLFQVFVGILVDPTDLAVVAPHPVPDRTAFAVRLAEVAGYVLVFVTAFTAGAVVLPLFAFPPLAVLFVYPLLALLGAAVTLGLVSLLFAVCLRLVGPTHFQRAALWLQILGGMGLVFALYGHDVVPREQWALWLEQREGLRLVLPPLLYAQLFEWAAGSAAASPGRAAVVALVVPLAALALTFVLASRYFVAGLQGTLGAPARRTGWERGLLSRIGSRLRAREERAGFDFALALSRREPHLLRGVLPQLAMFQAMAMGSGFGLDRDLAFYLPFSAGFLFVVLPNVLLQAQNTSAPEARVLFLTAPLESEDAFLRGGVKALLVLWMGVPAAVLVLVQLGAAGPGALPRVVLAFELAFVAALLFARRFRLGVPFTRSIRVGETNAANLGWIMLMSFAMVGILGVHAALALHPISLALGIAGSGLALVHLWRRLDGQKVAPDRRLLVPRTRLVVE